MGFKFTHTHFLSKLTKKEKKNSNDKQKIREKKKKKTNDHISIQ
jgi:hypothetical protein